MLIGGIAGAQFSPDGRRLYFVSSAWATSGAVHVIDLATRKERFFTDGSSLVIVPNGDYRGCLLIQKHKYFIGGGAYDWLEQTESNETACRRLKEEAACMVFGIRPPT